MTGIILYRTIITNTKGRDESAFLLCVLKRINYDRCFMINMQIGFPFETGKTMLPIFSQSDPLTVFDRIFIHKPSLIDDDRITDLFCHLIADDPVQICREVSAQYL